MAIYKIYYGLGGGFGGAENNEPEFARLPDKETAENLAYELACDEYESYAGLHGLRDYDQIMEEEECDEVTAEEIFREERESWLDYWVEEVKEVDENYV